MTAHSFIDTHTHLDDEQFDPDRDDVLDAALADGVTRFVNIGYSPKRWTSTLALAARRPEVSFALGLHPGNADDWSHETFEMLSTLVSTHRPSAIGEIGIDLYWRTDNLPVQIDSFQNQIDLALRNDLPIVIHQRMAGDEVQQVLAGTPGHLQVLLHSFDGHPGLARLAIERGWTIGVGGLSTRRQEEELRALLTEFPLDQIVLETDSPYLVPSGVKSRRNTPSAIPLIAERLANLRGIPVDAVAEATTNNASRLFGLPLQAIHQ